MLFNSFHFLIFFPIVTSAYFVLPHRFRWALILGASCYFYMVFIPKYILILAVTITVDFIAGIGIERFEGRRRKWLLLASIAANLGMLGFFKYFNFANENLAALANSIGWNYPVKDLAIILPIGLSFHTFQSLSYTLEVYRGNQKAERHFGYLAVYVMFYPQLVSGPIERPQNILHQLHEEHRFEYRRVADGLKWMAWGMFKKVVIADRMALFANPVYNSPTDYSGPALVLATLAFAIQIYCDFSGYSDIAFGSAKVMGVRLMKNFSHPYFASSVTEFWRRWHISLSTWFRDYLYIALGGNRVGRGRWAFNLFLTFLVSGLWHGANWTFVIWGALHGVYVVVWALTEKFRDRLQAALGLIRHPTITRGISTAFTFLLVCYAWIFFRAANVSDAFYISRHLLSGWDGFVLRVVGILNAALPAGFPSITNAIFDILALVTHEARGTILLTAAALVILLPVEVLQHRGNLLELINVQIPSIRLAIYIMLVAAILILGTAYSGTQQAFIYFQF